MTVVPSAPRPARPRESRTRHLHRPDGHTLLPESEVPLLRALGGERVRDVATGHLEWTDLEKVLEQTSAPVTH